jgi:hypothetical protein
MSRNRKSKRVSDDLVGAELTDVLDKIATFFLAAGVKPAALLRQLRRSIARSKPKPGISFVHDSQTLEQVRVIDIWQTSSKYANSAGKPKRLPVEGELSIASLMREAGMRGNPSKVANTYRCRDRIVNWKKVGEVAYAPQAAFLMNAVSASTMATNNDRYGKKLFWKFSLSDRLSEKLIDEYLNFVKEHSTILIRQLDDWLAQHESIKKRRSVDASHIAVGVGLFPFVQTVPVGKQVAPAKVRKIHVRCEQRAAE